MKKLIRITTVPISLEKLLEGQLNFMQQEYEVVAVSSNEKELKKLGHEIGVRTHNIEMTRKITPLWDAYCVVKLYFFLRREKPLIVHSHTPKAGIVSMIAARMAGVPIRLHTVAGLPLLEATGLKRRILVAVEKLTFKCATRIYPNSFLLNDYLLKRKYAPPHKLMVIGNGSSNGVDTGYFDPLVYSNEERRGFRQKLEIPEEDIVFVFVGRLVTDKGINELVDAFEELEQDFKNITLLLVGPFESELDPLKKSTLEKIKNLSKIKNVGYQKDVRQYFSISDVLVFPSYREGFPNVVLQAGAMGLPSIVTDINGCNEIISAGVNGLIIPVRDTASLCQGMKKMIQDKELRNLLRSRAREMVMEKFERKAIWHDLKKEYKMLEQKLNKNNK